MAKKEYAPAKEVREIAETLIALYHPHLVGIRIEYVFVSEPPVSLGRPLAGRARKVTGLNAFLATPDFEGEPEPFFVIEITLPMWDAKPFKWRIALVDHELKHCGCDRVTGQLYIVPHDEEEFDEIVERHGTWNEGLERFEQAFNSTDKRITEESFKHVNYGTVRKTEAPLAVIDLRRSQVTRDQQARSQA